MSCHPDRKETRAILSWVKRRGETWGEVEVSEQGAMKEKGTDSREGGRWRRGGSQHKSRLMLMENEVEISNMYAVKYDNFHV